MFVPVGEVDRTGPEGLAHYLEHLVVWSADKVHGEGLRNREMNAWTSPYWTTYWNRGPIDAFENMMRKAYHASLRSLCRLSETRDRNS